MACTIGVDIGTTNVKSILFGERSVILAQAGKEYNTCFPRPSWAQQNPEDWWMGTVETIREVLEESRIDPHEVKVISVSSQAPTMLPVDREGKPLHDALIWMDRRGTRELEMLDKTIGGDRIFDITGNRLDTYFMLSELAWFCRNRPELLDRTHKFLQVNGYVSFKLSGVFSIDYPHVSLTQLYDLNQKCWSKELFDAAGADISMMPDIYGCDQPLGTITGEAAALTGLSPSTVVLGGAVDSVAALEAGVYTSGAVEMTGTSSVLFIGCDHLVTDERLSHLNGIDEHSNLLYGAISTTGGCLKWYRDTIYNGPQEDEYKHIDSLIENDAADPSGIIFLPYMAGERAPIWDPNARGTFIGLSLSTTRAQLARAIMEGSCFALRDNLEVIESTGIRADEVYNTGGCANSDIWLRIKASIIGRPIVLPVANLGAPGGLAYIMSAYLGEYKTPLDAAKDCIRIKKIIEPVPEWTRIYDELYPRFKSAYQSLRDDFTKMAKY